jgi:hypothetical protein
LTEAHGASTIEPMGFLAPRALSDDEADALVWTLFGLRVSLSETGSGPRRDALLKQEQELVEALGTEIDPHLHGDVVRPPKTREHLACF